MDLQSGRRFTGNILKKDGHSVTSQNQKGHEHGEKHLEY